MKIYSPRPDFVIVEDYFNASQAAQWLSLIFEKGNDSQRGFTHPMVKANRFHKNPKYPVKKYMCFGLHWDPLDYRYHEKLPDKNLSPHPIPNVLVDLIGDVLKQFYHWDNFQPQSVLVNFYTKSSSMGLHVDKEEQDQISPVIGLSFGSACRFFYEDQAGEIQHLRLPGNSIYIFGKSARLMRHGVGTIYAKTLASGSEEFLVSKERMNLTIRQVRL